MRLFKQGIKDDYSFIEVFQARNGIVKIARFEFWNINFGRFDGSIRRARNDRVRYKLLADIYNDFVKIEIYPPETKFRVKGALKPCLHVEMPFVVMEVVEQQKPDLPRHKIAALERHIGLRRLFWDVYHWHNYGKDSKGDVYFVDLEVFPKIK